MTKLFPRLAFCFLTWSTVASAQAKDSDSFAGTWVGEIDYGSVEVPVVIDLEENPRGYTGEIKFPKSGKFGLPISFIHVDGRKISFLVERTKSEYEGRISGNRIRGDWTGDDGNKVELDLEREENGFEYVRPQNPREPFRYDVEEVVFANQFPGSDHKLSGVLAKPTRPLRPVPAVILISDGGPHDRDGSVASHRPFAVLADHLTREGIAVLRFDERGTGKSTGFFDAANTKDFALDVESAFEFLKTQEDIDPSRIGLIGHGEGGVVGSIVAAKKNDVDFLVMLAGYGLPGDMTMLAKSETLGRAAGVPQPILDTNRELSLGLFKLLKEQEVDGEKLANLGAELGKGLEALGKNDTRDEAGAGDFGVVVGEQFKDLESFWLRSFVKLDPAESLKMVECPVLALNGDRDLEVPADLHLAAIEKALKSGGNEKVMVRKLAGLNHLFQTAESGFPNQYSAIEETIAPSVLKGISQWIAGVTAN